MACCCKPVPVILVTGIESNTATGIVTFTLASPVPDTGRFTLKFNLCCTDICPCGTSVVNFQYGTTVTSAIYDPNLNRLQIGQLRRQIRCFGRAHFYASESPTGNIISKDCLKKGMYNGPITSNATTVTVTDTAGA